MTTDAKTPAAIAPTKATPTPAIRTLADLAHPARARRLVVKIGSALLVEGGHRDKGTARDWLAGLTAEIAEARARGQQVIVVSSGAIALGAGVLGLSKGGRGSLADAQAAAAVGQIALAGLWAELLARQGLVAAQLLLTLDDLEDRRRYLNAAATLARLAELGVVPVINENDSVATEEIRFGDNDRLAARVAQAARAEAVVLLSDVDGLYDRHPDHAEARRLAVVPRLTPAIRAMASAASGSGLGAGGMAAKLAAAEIATRAGIALAIGNGRAKGGGGNARPLARLFGNQDAEGIGTLFLPQAQARARQAWLGGRLRLKGTLTIDDGAAKALASGASLLAAGVIAVEGRFARGDAVAIRAAGGALIAHGLSEYDARACAALIGQHSRAHGDILGYAPRSAIVHRDQLVLV